MARRRQSSFGARFNSPFNGRAPSRRAAGIYPTKATGLGEYGGTAYPTIIEAYNRNSDYRRWRLGMEYYAGLGRSWGDIQFHALARFVTATDAETSRVVTTLFPSEKSPEGAWHASCRVRGSLLLQAPLTAPRVSLLTSSPDLGTHTLALDVSDLLDAAQLELYTAFIGDQFEDSAGGPNYPQDLIPYPAGSVALTLVGVNREQGILYFDLSRPALRLGEKKRIFWELAAYDPAAPLLWQLDGSRYLCSSFKFFCSCPDHTGGMFANLETPEKSSVIRQFPVPASGRSGALEPNIDGSLLPLAPWESQGAGYYRQWRSLSRRRDQRRECKHIHALRWECGIPWREPSDYPTGEERAFGEAVAVLERRISDQEFYQYQHSRQLNRRYLISVAEAVGINLYPPGDPRAGFRADPRPMLWNDPEDPYLPGCQMNDWWITPAGKEVSIFNATSGAFEQTVTVGSNQLPVLQLVEPDAIGAPQIVP